MAEYVRIYEENPNPKEIEKVVNILRKGGLIIYPTDTVYGLGCDITNLKALERVARIKGIKLEKSNFSFVCHDLSNLSDYVKQIDTSTFKILKRALPGPYTFILPGARSLPAPFKQKKMSVQTKETQSKLSPQDAVQMLLDGNKRFLDNAGESRDLLDQVKATATGQYPFATVLSCIDSRIPTEIIFDQGVGDLFNARIAGNFINEDILGSMEFACKLAGTKIIVVLGHTACGAVKGACDDAKLGNLTALINKIKPAVEAVKEPKDSSLRNSSNIEFVNTVAEQNVHMTIDNIRNQSPVLKEMEDDGVIKIVGAMYNIQDGSVVFY